MDFEALFYQEELQIKEMTGFSDLTVRGVPLDHRQTLEKLKNEAVAKELARVSRIYDSLTSSANQTQFTADWFQDEFVKGRMTDLKSQLLKIQEILDEPVIQALIQSGLELEENEIPF